MERRRVCRYFERGACRKDNCPFVHVREQRKNCQFFLRGHCRKGNQCNFFHPPNEDQIIVQAQKHLRQNKSHLKQQPLSQQHFNNISSEEEQVQKINQKQTLHLINAIQQQYIETQEEKQLNFQNILHSEQARQQQLQFGINSQTGQKIDFLVGMEQLCSQSKSVEQFEQRNKINPFLRTFKAQFIDLSKSASSKQFIQLNEDKYFKDKKFLALIAQLQDPIAKEHYQIIRKYQDSYVQIECPFKIFTVNLRPLLYQKQIMLHFQLLQPQLQFRIDATQYPKNRALFSIVNPSIPPQYKIKIQSWVQRHHQKYSIFDTLKKIINNFQHLYTEAKFKLENQYYSHKENSKKHIPKLLQKAVEKTQDPVEKKQVQGHRALIQMKYNKDEKIQISGLNIELSVDSLKIQNCNYLIVDRVLLYLVCVCEKQLAYILQANRETLLIGVRLKCRKCSNVMRIAFERNICQINKTVLGRIGIDSGSLEDVGGIAARVGCNCDEQIFDSRLLLPAQRHSLNCLRCFKTINLVYMGLRCYNPLKAVQGMQEEKELPAKGTCVHLPLEYRWLRFGCCGRKFCCTSGHIMYMTKTDYHRSVQGLTMICGFCSKEQLLNKTCIFCKKELIKGVDKTGHWEGGTGCRNPALMSKKDAKKYMGLTKKNK